MDDLCDQTHSAPLRIARPRQAEDKVATARLAPRTDGRLSRRLACRLLYSCCHNVDQGGSAFEV